MPEKIQRRVAGQHNIRLDGMQDLLSYCSGRSVMDIGCNRGMVAYEFYLNGAVNVYGCDNYAEGIEVARHVFADVRDCRGQFEVVDLTQGPRSLSPFVATFDITVMLATYHKLKRIMPKPQLSELVQYIGQRTTLFFAWRGTSDKQTENEEEMAAIDADLHSGFRRIHTSYLSGELGLCAIWRRR